MNFGIMTAHVLFDSGLGKVNDVMNLEILFVEIVIVIFQFLEFIQSQCLPLHFCIANKSVHVKKMILSEIMFD